MKVNHLGSIVFTTLLALGIPCGSAHAGEAAFNGCHARWSGDELVIGNSRVERKWRISRGLLTATSFRNQATGTEWIREPAAQPAPVPASPGAGDHSVTISATTSRAGVNGEEALQILMEARGATDLTYRFRIYPEAAGVEMFLDSPPARDAPAQSTSRTADGIETGPEKSAAVTGDSLENLTLSPRNLKLTQVTFMDQTDVHNELVQQNEWMLLNQRNLELTGNLFDIEDTVSSEGLVFLKLAPLPHARTVRSAYDCQLQGAGRRVRFAGQGYPFVLLAYSGGRAGRTAVLHDFQRQLRRYEPDRDAMFLSNTWGDRSRDGHINEKFILKEIAAAARLGVDVVQIDDGWQKGRSANSSKPEDGAWGSFWAADSQFWQTNPERFPRGLGPVVKAARDHGMKVGLWYAPDSADSGANWQRDAERLIELHQSEGIGYFKFDAVSTATSAASRNFRQLLDRLQAAGQITIDLDITGGIRPGYFGTADCGPIFVENRYTDWQNYKPHLTLRNLWLLSQYVDPLRLRMEFLNNSRNAAGYGDDPLAPARYSPDALFATVMFSNPLGWFEVSNLPESYTAAVAPLVSIWKRERARLFGGRIMPIGDAPDGACWTGFLSSARDGKSADLLVFRELNDDPHWTPDLKRLGADFQRATILAGKGEAAFAGGKLTARIPEKLGYLWLRLEQPAPSP